MIIVFFSFDVWMDARTVKACATCSGSRRGHWIRSAATRSCTEILRKTSFSLMLEITVILCSV